MAQMRQRVEDMARHAGGNKPAIIDTIPANRCGVNRGSGSAVGDDDLRPSASSADASVPSHRR